MRWYKLPHLRTAASSTGLGFTGHAAPLLHSNRALIHTAAASSAGGKRRDRDLIHPQMILPAARITTPGRTQGSGFVFSVGDNGTYVLTCHHVIKDCIQQDDRWDPVEKSSKKVERYQPVSVELFRYDGRGRHTQTIVTSSQVVAYTAYGDQWDFEGDLAVLKLRTPIEGLEAANIIGEDEFLDEFRVLDPIVMVGCPGSEIPLPTTGHVASISEEHAGVGLLLSQIFGAPGSSGSAIYRYSEERNAYEVVAVHSMIDSRGRFGEEGGFLRLAVPVTVLYNFLKTHDLMHLLPNITESDDPPNITESDDPPADDSSAGNEDAVDDAKDAVDDASDATPPAAATDPPGDDPGKAD